MGPVTSGISTNPSPIISKSFESIGSKSDSDVQTRAKTDETQPAGVELARSQTSSSSGRDQRRGSVLDLSV